MSRSMQDLQGLLQIYLSKQKRGNTHVQTKTVAWSKFSILFPNIKSNSKNLPLKNNFQDLILYDFTL